MKRTTRRRDRALFLSAASLLAPSLVLPSMARAAEITIVRDGKSVDATTEGREWRTEGERLTCSGVGNYLWCPMSLGGGDARVRARLAIQNLKGSAASFVIGASHFGFSGRDGRPFVEGALFGGRATSLEAAAGLVREGEPFTFEVAITKGTARFAINQREVRSCKFERGEPLRFGLRPWRSTMAIEEFTASGDLASPPVSPVEEQHLWTSGQGGYHTYRIPAIVATTRGTLIAFCEGRKGGRGDAGDIDMMLRRSTDGGRTWSESACVWDDGGNTCGNPCPVVDRDTGTVWLLMTWNRGDDHERDIIGGRSRDTRRVFVMRSENDGETWSAPEEITRDAKLPDWTWYATGPGNGIRIERGPHKGRLLIPCDHIEAGTKRYFSHAVYSDDRGRTWRLGGSAPRDKTNECTVVELSDGRLMLNMRNYDRSKRARMVCTSADGGATWTDQHHDAALIEPICQASILRYSWPDEATGKGRGRSRVLFSNPANAGGRTRMTVRVSYDEGLTWPAARLVHAGGSAYSCLVRTPDGSVGCLYEKDGYRTITLATMSVEWLDASAEPG